FAVAIKSNVERIAKASREQFKRFTLSIGAQDVPGGKEHVSIKQRIIKRAGNQSVVRIMFQRRVGRDAPGESHIISVHQPNCAVGSKHDMIASVPDASGGPEKQLYFVESI